MAQVYEHPEPCQCYSTGHNDGQLVSVSYIRQMVNQYLTDDCDCEVCRRFRLLDVQLVEKLEGQD